MLKQYGNEEDLEAGTMLKAFDYHKPWWLHSHNYAIGICNFYISKAHLSQGFIISHLCLNALTFLNFKIFSVICDLKLKYYVV